jgi:23S rRNA pseudouridine1911/1915/1917 synthase
MKDTFTIKEEDKKKRLDKFLTEELVDLSRSQIKKMIIDGQVLVNGEEASVHKFLKEDDTVKILKETEKTIIKEKINEKRGKKNIKLFDSIKVIAEENNFIIIEKPAGMLVHPTDKEENDTLVDWLLEKYPDIRGIGEDPSRPALVHRLDKDVSGLMLIPKTQDAFDFFKQQFKLRIIDKKYTALVHGEITNKDNDEINFPISRSKTKEGLFAAHPKVRGEKFTEKDREAITEFIVKERFKNFTLLEVKILTGRTHQIRVHLTAYGHHIVGDKLYLNRKLKSKKELNRIFLHAGHLAFTDPDNKKYEFKSPLPEKLADFMETLKKI